MTVLKSWRLHVFALIIVLISELIGKKSIPLGPGVLLFLPMLYAMAFGAVLSWPRIKVMKLPEMKAATSALGILTLLLITKLGLLIGPSVSKLVSSGVALILQELGHFLGTVALGLPIALLLGLGRETVGATFSIGREPNIAIIAEKYGIDSPEGRGTMAVYIIGTMFGTVWLGLFAGYLAALHIFHPFALAMGAGVGSGSMMAAVTGAITTVYPQYGNEILMYAGASNLITTIVGIYFCLFISLPVTEYLYVKLSPVIGRGPEHRRGGRKEEVSK